MQGEAGRPRSLGSGEGAEPPGTSPSEVTGQDKAEGVPGLEDRDN